MDSNTIIATLIISVLSATLSGIVVYFLSINNEIKKQKKALKIDLIKNIIGFRWQLFYDMSFNEISYYLNQIFVIFNDSDEVIKAYEEFRKNTEPKHKQDKALNLLKTMMRNVDINYNNINDSYFYEPAIPINVLNQLITFNNQNDKYS